MANAKEKGLMLLASVASVDMKTAGKTTLYTVPIGKNAVVTHIVIHTVSATLAGGTEYDFGTGANCDTWKQDVDLSSMTAATDVMVIDSNNTKYTRSTAADTFGIKVITGSTGAATATIDVIGIEY